MHPNKNTGCRAGFTLTELLIVIVIILILAGLILPAIVKAREKGRQANCWNNLHQISLSLTMYEDDHQAKMPDFLSSLYPRYIPYGREENLICKSDRSDPRGSAGSKPNVVDPTLGDQYVETDDISANGNPLRNPAIKVCSYMYECSAAQCSWDYKSYLGVANDSDLDMDGNGLVSWYEAKMYQLKHGDTTNGNKAYDATVFPVVRCFHHYKERQIEVDNPTPPPATVKQGLTMNVAYAGNVFQGPLHWELFGGGSH